MRCPTCRAIVTEYGYALHCRIAHGEIVHHEPRRVPSTQADRDVWARYVVRLDRQRKAGTVR